MSHWNQFRPWHLAVAVAAAIAAGCGGGGGGDDTSNQTTSTRSSNPDEPASVQSVSGTVEAPTNVTLASRSIGDEMLAAVGHFVSPLEAAVSGLEPKANVSVSLVRLANDGTIAETLATTTTDDSGNFSFEVDVEATGDVVVRAGGSDQSLRAPAGGDDVAVNPVSENVVRKVVDNVSSGSSFDQYSATELATLVGVILDELEAQGASFSGATDVDSAVQTADGSGSTGNLVTESEGDSGIEFTGEQNLAVLGVETEADGSTASFSIESQALNTRLAAGPSFDLAGEAVAAFDTRVEWAFDGGQFTPNVTGDFNEETISADEGIIDLALGSTGRLIVRDSNGQGGVSRDGERFAFASTDGNNFANLVVGAASWSPGSIDQTYNMIRYNPYIDNTEGASDEFRPYTVGVSTTQRFTIDLSCTSGSCDIVSTPDPSDDRGFYVQSGPEGFQTQSDTAEGDPVTVDFEDSFDLTSKGRIEGAASTGEYRGLVAPGGEMLVIQYELNGEGGPFPNYPGHSFYMGVPQGTSCDDTTLDGTYNMAGLANTFRDQNVDSDTFDGSVSTETTGFALSFNGDGTVDFPGSTYVNVDLSFNAGGSGAPMTDRSLGSDGSDDFTYTVNSDCTVDIDNGGSSSPGGSETIRSVNAVVSPDGNTLILGDYTKEFTASDQDSVFTQLLVGYRAPQ